MKSLHKFSLLFVILLLAGMTLSSCEWDNSPEPDFPTRVTYAISAGYTEYSGPEQLITDIQKWIKENEMGYAADANYSTGAASEFVRQDAQAAQEMNKFLKLFQDYLNNDVRRALAAGTYGQDVTVRIAFYVYVVRYQGEDRTIKTETVMFTYPN